MSLQTSNIYGKISISDDAIAVVASLAAGDCYGVSELVSRKLSDSLSEMFNRVTIGRGIRVNTIENLIFLDVYVTLKFGVNVEAVKKSIESAVKYSVETFSGMRVRNVNVSIVGVRV